MKFRGSAIAEAERGHRRGVVLGLTMAELMLLLLFCLLLVSAGIFKTKDEELQRLRTANLPASELADQLRELQTQLETLRDMSPDHEWPLPEENWTELMLARDYVRALKDGGVTPAILVEADFLKLTTEIATQSPEARTSLLEKIKPSPDAVSSKGARPTEDLSSSGEHEWPPIITLSDDGYFFERGSAELTSEFSLRLRTTVTQNIASLLKRYKVDVVEIVGHTDEQPIYPTRPSNLDAVAIAVLNGVQDADSMIPVDNAGLGLARAVAVASALGSTDELRGTKTKIIPLSAAQLVLPGDAVADGTKSGDMKARRRIEIRVRRSSDPTSPAWSGIAD